MLSNGLSSFCCYNYSYCLVSMDTNCVFAAWQRHMWKVPTVLIPVPLLANILMISTAYRKFHTGHNFFQFLHSSSQYCLLWTHLNCNASSNILSRFMGFGLVKGFIDHLYTRLGTTSNYSGIANLYIHKSPQCNLFQAAASSPAVPWQQLLTVEILQLHVLRFYLHSLLCRTACEITLSLACNPL
jgi:hypothetical protein